MGNTDEVENALDSGYILIVQVDKKVYVQPGEGTVN